MKIEVTLAELNSVVESLNNLVKVPMPAKYAFRFGKVAKQLQSELADLRTHRNALYTKHGETQEDGNIQVKPENLQNFYKEVEDLLSEKIDLSFEPMPISLLNDSTVTIADMAWLDKFFVDDLSEDEEGTDDAAAEEETQVETVIAGA